MGAKRLTYVSTDLGDEAMKDQSALTKGRLAAKRR
jgi:hypothetical protein